MKTQKIKLDYTVTANHTDISQIDQWNNKKALQNSSETR